MLKKNFINGFVTLIPIIITVALLIWIFQLIENVARPLIELVISPQFYFPGLSILVFVVLVFVFGVFLNHWVVEKLYSKFETLLNKMPLIKTLYGSIQDLLSLFKQDPKKMKQRVARVNFGGVGVLGLVTRDDFNDLPKGVGQDGEIALFIPLSYQMGGITIMVKKSAITLVDMPVEEALRFAITAGMPGLKSPNIRDNHSSNQPNESS
jgi:uncharacterized membrane protein